MIPAWLPIGLLHFVRFRNFCLNPQLRSDSRSVGTQSGHPSTIAAKHQQVHQTRTPRRAAASFSERSFPMSRLCDLNESSDSSCWRFTGTAAIPTDALPMGQFMACTLWSLKWPRRDRDSSLAFSWLLDSSWSDLMAAMVVYQCLTRRFARIASLAPQQAIRLWCTAELVSRASQRSFSKIWTNLFATWPCFVIKEPVWVNSSYPDLALTSDVDTAITAKDTRFWSFLLNRVRRLLEKWLSGGFGVSFWFAQARGLNLNLGRSDLCPSLRAMLVIWAPWIMMIMSCYFD